MKFGTSGLRGLATDLLGPQTAAYAIAFAERLSGTRTARPGDQVFIGRDLRESSVAISAMCAEVLSGTGLDIIDCGELPTPALAGFAWSNKAAALMVTGSHIPADRNGIKFFLPGAEIDKADEAAMTAMVETAGPAAKPSHGAGAVVRREADALAWYRDRGRAMAAEGALSGMKIGVYEHSSVARNFLIDLLESIGAEIVSLGRTSRFVAIDTEAVPPQTIETFAAWTKEHALDAIVSTDGDGDRPLIADETGAQLRGDVIGLVTARMVGADIVVTPVTSNSGINSGIGFEVLRTKVGSPFVLDAMEKAAGRKADKTVVGFEANGGFMLGSSFDHGGMKGTALPTRDAMLPILAVLQSARREKIALSALVGRWALPVSASDRLESFPVERSQALMARLSAQDDALKQFLSPLGAIVSVDRTDGLRATLSSGEIVHLRPSGNAPEMRCYTEGATPARAQALMAEALECVRRWRQ
ncbi:MAG: phosphomannomutase [Hyphomicrobiales bacterium]|nr:phosphomannomutase [Hyphomicrobiales bacterium]